MSVRCPGATLRASRKKWGQEGKGGKARTQARQEAKEGKMMMMMKVMKQGKGKTSPENDTYNSPQQNSQHLRQPQEQYEIRYPRRLSRRLLEHLLRVRMVPIFIVAFNWEVDVEAVRHLSVHALLHTSEEGREVADAKGWKG